MRWPYDPANEKAAHGGFYGVVASSRLAVTSSMPLACVALLSPAHSRVTEDVPVFGYSPFPPATAHSDQLRPTTNNGANSLQIKSIRVKMTFKHES